MENLKIISSRKNEYYYDDNSGFLYPEGRRPYPAPGRTLQSKAAAGADDIGNYLSHNGYRQLLLEVTQRCNMRCRYCVYSEHYENTRMHGNGDMLPETAFRAVDDYFSHFEKVSLHNPMRDPAVSFYGGEPLVNFSLIRSVVEYIKSRYPQFHVNYNVTTNGLLLSEEVSRFLTENRFSVIVSLDGDEKNHDRNRRKADGGGSFAQVYDNIRRFREAYPGYGRFGLSVCMDYRSDLEEMEKFFRENHFFIVILNMINDLETDYYQGFTAEDRMKFALGRDRLKETFLSLARRDGIFLSDHSFLFSLFGAGYVETCFHSLLDSGRPYFMPCTGSCIPGEKIYVTVNGDYHMCERISPHFPIGNVERGLDLERIAEYVNAFNRLTVSCSRCSVGRMCSICFARATEGGGIRLPEDYCEKRSAYIRGQLTEYVDLMEDRPDGMDKLLTSYYVELKEIAGDVYY